MARQGAEKQALDRRQVTDYLYRAFEKATEHLGPRSKAVAGTELHRLQCDMAWLIDRIERDPEASAKAAITQANKLINEITEGETA